ncbi:hypothetical protein ACFE04_026262 [Oxalis oulophora]
MVTQEQNGIKAAPPWPPLPSKSTFIQVGATMAVTTPIDEQTQTNSSESDDFVAALSESIKKQTISTEKGNTSGEAKQSKCITCNAYVGDAKELRDHFKSDKHNITINKSGDQYVIK